MSFKCIAICIALALAPATAQAGGHAAKGSASMVGPDGADMGTVTFTATPHGVLIEADLKGIPAGGHGFHLHENGSCQPDFGAAGGHFNPAGREHGFTNEAGYHAGDLPNIFSGDDGAVRVNYLTNAVSLDAETDVTLFDGDGTAVIVHENPDTYAADAGAGGRIACGVVEMN